MNNHIKTCNHYFLYYVENIELREIKNYILKDRDSKKLLSLEDKVVILKLHELYKMYQKQEHDKIVSLENFLKNTVEGSMNDLDNAKKIFESYFIAKGQYENLNKAIKKLNLLNKLESYNFLEALRKDKLESRLRKILWHVPSGKKDIFDIYMGNTKKESISESFYYLANKENYEPLGDFLGIDMDSLIQSDNENTTSSFIFGNLKQKLKSRKVIIEDLTEEHKCLQEDLKGCYSIAEFYYFT